MNSGWQVLTTASSRIEAELIVGHLESCGVRAVVSADDEGGMNLALQPGRVRILVLAEDEGDALKILDEIEEVRPEQKLPSTFQRWMWRLLGGGTSKPD